MSHKMTEEMVRFPVSVPKAVHLDFKLMCVREGVPMTERVRKLLERELAAHTKPAKRAVSDVYA
jgi:hypothetical protein